jgi:hypothetical protein
VEKAQGYTVAAVRNKAGCPDPVVIPGFSADRACDSSGYCVLRIHEEATLTQVDLVLLPTDCLLQLDQDGR